MEKLKLEDIVFWLIIGLIIALVVWLLSGSPTDTSAIIALATFVAASEILLWKAHFSVDKKTAIGFERVYSEIKMLKKDMNYQLNEIKGLIKK